MGKVPDDEPLVDRHLALEPDAGSAAQGAVRVVRVGAVHAELDGARVGVDGGVAIGQGTGAVLVSGVMKDGCLVKGPLSQKRKAAEAARTSECIAAMA